MRARAAVLLRLSVAIFALTGCDASRPAPPASARNLLLVTLDTTRADYVSGSGGPPGITPNLAALGNRSTVFLEARSETNVTNPSHVTILSGLRAIEHGLLNNGTHLPDGIDTLPEAFARAGYRTAGIVAIDHLWRIGWRGFDALPEVESLPAEEVTDRAIDWLRGCRASACGERPFFLWVHYFDAHSLYEPPPEHARRFYRGDRTAGNLPPIRATQRFAKGSPDRRIVDWLGDTRDRSWPRAMYAAELHRIDAALARLFAAVEAGDDTRETVLVVTADHGESLGEHGIYYHHRGLYEQTLRIPLVIHVPGAPPRRSALPVTTLDVAPTLVDLFGLELANPSAGASLLPIVLGEDAPALEERRLFVYQHAHNFAVAAQEGPWKLIWGMRELPPLPAGPQLFDLASDPAERNDVASEHPDRVAALRKRVEPWIELGPVSREAPHLDEAALERLRALGYADP